MSDDRLKELRLRQLQARQKLARDAMDAQTPDGAVYQGMSGVNEGIAGLLGAPVDITTAGINAATGGINRIVGTEIPPIENPAGGSETFKRMMGPAISDKPPMTPSERYARSIGREAGAMVIPGLAQAKKLQAAGQGIHALATGAASAIGAGTAGQAAEDLGADPSVRLVAELLGGAAPVGASYLARKGPQAPTMDDLRARQKAAYDKVDAGQARLSTGARDEIVDALRSRAKAENVDDLLHPKASRSLDLVDEKMPANPTIADVERKRRFIGRNVAGALDEGERKVGVAMKDEIDDYLRNLDRNKLQGADADEVIDALEEGREMTKRIKRSEAFDDAIVRGERRAATSGSGGNEVNAIRQNIRAILDSPKKSRQFSAEQLAEMDRVARGTVPVNRLRDLGKLAPTSGALPLAGNVGGLAASGGDPLMLGLMGMSSGAKFGAERITQNQVRKIAELIRNGAPLDPKRLSEAERAIAAALIAGNAPEGMNQLQQ